NGELQISQNTTIIGLDAAHLTISGSDGLGGSSRVFDITSSAAIVSISGMTIANGNAEVFYTSIAGNQGGDIFNSGNLTLSNCIVSNGLSVGIVGGPDGRGGAIFNATGSGGKGAFLTLDHTIVQGSTAQGSGGGALGAGGGIYNDTNATL